MASAKNVTEVRQFLGLCSYYRRFVKNFSLITKPLNNLTTKEASLNWDDKCQEAFDTLKTKLASPGVMAFPQDKGTYILDTDACDVGIGAVLSQQQDGVERVVAYGSHSLNRAESNYCVTDKELLAVRYFMEYFRHYLLGRTFMVRTDHQAIRWLFQLKHSKGRIARWIEILSAYNFSIEYRPGKRHGNADALSRCPNPCDCQCAEYDNLEALRCGPCNKCQKRSLEMKHNENAKEQSQQASSEQTQASRQTGGSVFSRLRCLLSVLLSMIFSMLCPSWSQRRYVRVQHDDSPVIENFESVNDDSQEPILDDGRLWPKLNGSSWLKEPSHGNRIAPVKGKPKPSSSHEILNYSVVELQKEQGKDTILSKLLDCKLRHEKPPKNEVAASSPEFRHYINYWDSIRVKDKVLHKQVMTPDGRIKWLLLVPKQLRKSVVDSMHNSVFGGHLGTKKTLNKILQSHYWFNLRDDVTVWVKQCDVCARNKRSKVSPKAAIGDMRTGASMDRLGIDIMGPLPLSNKGNKYIQVITDAFTKWVEIRAIPDQTAVTCAEHLVDSMICHFGCPLVLHSDQGRNYDGRLIKELCRLLEIRKSRTTPRHPQSNGQTERFNRTIVQMIKSFLKGEQRNWDQHLECLAAAYRAAKHETTGFTPNFLMLGREVRLPGEIFVPQPEESNPAVYVDDMRQYMAKAHEIVRKRMELAMLKQADLYDPKGRLVDYKPGDLVWYRNEAFSEGACPKLQDIYVGPYVVLHKYPTMDYLVQKNKQGKQVVVHHDKLKPYEGKSRPRWVQVAVKKFLGKRQ